MKGRCKECNRVKKLPYTEDQLSVEGEGIKKLFKELYKKVVKPVGKRIAKNPGRALEIISDFGEAYVTKDIDKAVNTVSNSLKYLKTGKGLYLY